MVPVVDNDVHFSECDDLKDNSFVRNDFENEDDDVWVSFHPSEDANSDSLFVFKETRDSDNFCNTRGDLFDDVRQESVLNNDDLRSRPQGERMTGTTMSHQPLHSSSSSSLSTSNILQGTASHAPERSTREASVKSTGNLPQRPRATASSEEVNPCTFVDTKNPRDIIHSTRSQWSQKVSNSYSQETLIEKKKNSLKIEPLADDATTSHCDASSQRKQNNKNTVLSPSTQLPDPLHSRTLLSATVYNNSATWITTINTNQKGVATNRVVARKYLKAFSFRTEQEARESAIANAPPKLISFTTSPNCFVCNRKFSVFRRASHCRNCGVCVCSSCSTKWPSKMVPQTYNLKRGSYVSICKTCHYLSGAFKEALLKGEYDTAISLYETGNINLRCPFPNFVKGNNSNKCETMVYPVHCAVEGGNLNIVRWLIDERHVPIRSMQKSSNNTKNRKKNRKQCDHIPLLLTSQDRSILSIAMFNRKIDILQYLITEKRLSVYETNDLRTALRALEATILKLPPIIDCSRHGVDFEDEVEVNSYRISSSNDSDN